MKYLKAEKQATQLYFLIHMDETKVLEDGSPDPEYLREFTWGLQPPTEVQTEAEYVAMMKREMGLLVEHELSVRNQQAPEPIPLDGF